MVEMRRIYDPAIETQARKIPRLDLSDPIAAREAHRKFMQILEAQGVERPSDPRVREVERTIPGPPGAPEVRIRIYLPTEPDRGPRPAFVNFHGGAFILGDLETEHPRCLVMSAQGGAVSVGVDYRLAPENPFPAGLEDCYAALCWVAEHAEELGIDPSRLAVGGGSAGGNLAAAVSLLARDRGGPAIALQMLFYPVLDDRCETPSMKLGRDLYVWDYDNSLLMWDHYLGKERTSVSPYAAPARAEDLSGLPPAYIMTAEHDPLRDEAIIYAMRLMEAGVPVELHNYPGTVHGFDFMTPSDVSVRAVRESVEVFRRVLGVTG
ncbi:MAG: alpha/beta hydrolase [Thermoleophilia bacterium]|nr:alpha/beta hydrolase [Thermoleophilia bacterium]